MLQLFLTYIPYLCCAILFGSYLFERSQRIRFEKLSRDTVERLQTAFNDVSKFPDYAERLKEAEYKSDSYFKKIDEVIQEREVWRELYNDQAAGHENAQALMMATITHLLQVYRRDTGKMAPNIDPMILQVQTDWLGAHGTEVRETRGEDGKPKQDT